jgi:endogenous inhibitor of DNA gyrase (YacG/DUF329 family)
MAGAAQRAGERPMKWQCPYCRRELEAQAPEDLPHTPFCSARCKMAELERWLSGRYVISRPLAEGDIGEATAADVPGHEAAGLVPRKPAEGHGSEKPDGQAPPRRP